MWGWGVGEGGCNISKKEFFENLLQVLQASIIQGQKYPHALHATTGLKFCLFKFILQSILSAWLKFLISFLNNFFN